MSGFIVRVRCTVFKDVVCEDCTEEQARQAPFDHAVDELHGDTVDWEVLDVSPNE